MNLKWWHWPCRIIPFPSLCQSYAGIGGEIAGGIVRLDSKPIVISLKPGAHVPRSSCDVTISAKKGEGIAVHIEYLNLPSVRPKHCSSWLQIESESESNKGTWIRTKSFSEQICGKFDQRNRNFSTALKTWQPGHQFYNETTSNVVTIRFNVGTYQPKQLSFEMVITPLILDCDLPKSHDSLLKYDRFKCGGSLDYCIDASLVCDTKVNCMLPHREGSDELNSFCKNSRNALRNNSNLVTVDPGKRSTAYILYTNNA